MTRDELGKCIGLLTEAFPQSKPSPGTVAVYWRLFANEDAAAFLEACGRAILEHDWFPTAKQLNEILRGRLAGAGMSASDAWAEVRSYVSGRAWDPEVEPPWSDPRIKQGMAVLGGFKNYCATATTDELMSSRARFIAAYESASTQQRHDDVEQQITAAGIARLPGADIGRIK